MSDTMSIPDPPADLHLDEFTVTDGRRLDFGPMPGEPLRLLVSWLAQPCPRLSRESEVPFGCN